MQSPAIFVFGSRCDQIVDQSQQTLKSVIPNGVCGAGISLSFRPARRPNCQVNSAFSVTAKLGVPFSPSTPYSFSPSTQGRYT